VSWNMLPPSGQIDGDKSVATFNAPFGVTTDLQQNVYVADLYNNKIRKITPAGYVSTFAGGDYYNSGHKDGSSVSALFYSPYAVAADISGNIFVIDGEEHLLRKITTSGMVSTLLGPLEPAITGYYDLFSTGALAIDKAGNVFFSIPVGIIKMTQDGKIIRYAVGGTGITDGPAQVATFSAINGIAIDDSGNLFITDKNRIRKIAWQ
jgi:serine/threonine protein kinase, bacterial